MVVHQCKCMDCNQKTIIYSSFVVLFNCQYIFPNHQKFSTYMYMYDSSQNQIQFQNS